ncbi:MAG: protein kinase, partial [Planctomycetaceae bacterium]|nr:protein kinase [Planctomycetaceae bacterium]
KPANLLLDLRGTIWVTDFGLAKLDDERGLTQTGDILGTLRYMAPETFRGTTDTRSEVYSLGLTLYEMVALRPAFGQVNRNMLVEQVMAASAEPLSKATPDVPVDLETIIQKAIERDPQHRYQTAGDLADDLQRFLDDEPVRARRITLLERAVRWSRHNRGLSASLAVVLLLLLIVNIAGPIYTWRIAQLNENLTQSERNLSTTIAHLQKTTLELSDARDEAQKIAADNLNLAVDAETARQRIQTVLADMETERGLMASRENDAATAMLWFAQASQETPHDPLRQRENLMRARNEMRRSAVPVALLEQSHGGEQQGAFFQPNGRLLLGINDGAMTLWDWRINVTTPWTDQLSGVIDAAWSPDGQLLAISMTGRSVEVRLPISGKVVAQLQNDPNAERIHWLPDGSGMIIAGTRLELWKRQPNQEQYVRARDWALPDRGLSIAINPQGTRVAVGCRNHSVVVFAIQDANNLPSPLFPAVPHQPLFADSPPVFVSGGNELVTLTEEGFGLGWWDATAGTPAGPATARNTPLSGGRRLIASHGG